MQNREYYEVCLEMKLMSHRNFAKRVRVLGGFSSFRFYRLGEGLTYLNFLVFFLKEQEKNIYFTANENIVTKGSFAYSLIETRKVHKVQELASDNI